MYTLWGNSALNIFVRRAIEDLKRQYKVIRDKIKNTDGVIREVESNLKYLINIKFGFVTCTLL